MAFSPDRVEVREKVEKVSAKRMRLWHALHDFIRQHGGAVVSVPGHEEYADRGSEGFGTHS